MSISTQAFPGQRDVPTPAYQDGRELSQAPAHQPAHGAVHEAVPEAALDPDHDHAWRQVEDPDQPLLLGMYRCDLCHVEWAL